MNEDTISIEHPTTSEQVATVEDGSPYKSFPQESVMHRIGMFAGPFIFGAIYLAVVIFLIVLFYRLVRAVEGLANTTERIADKIEYCYPPKQNN
jgi:hypothetical protein